MSIIFQAISWHAQDVDLTEYYSGDGEDGDGGKAIRYIIKVFGVCQDGMKVSASILDFTPYFYIRVPETWGRREAELFRNFLCESLYKSDRSELQQVRLLRKQDFWGFSNFKEFNFLRLTFATHKTMRKVMYLLSKPVNLSSLQLRNHTFKLYESNIDPYIRFIHLRDLLPCGWIELPASSYRKKTEILPTTSQLDVEVSWQNVKRYDCDVTAPFTVASFDIECMSDTGDFPVPKDKHYKKLASDVYENYGKLVRLQHASNPYVVAEAIRATLLGAFGIESTTTADLPPGCTSACRVYPIEPCDDDLPRIKSVLSDIVADVVTKLTNVANAKRESVIDGIDRVLCSSKLNLPKVRGDAIIQIGTTFHRYGERECYRKTIFTLGDTTEFEGAEVRCFASEAKMLLAWRDHMQAANPDIITGYNIFGFDFSYMVDRTEELGIKNDFLRLSRFRERVCAYQTKTLSSSALGDNIMKFIDMEGRVLIDLMKVVQRDHKLDSYKLDTVASHFMGMNKNDVSPQEIFKLQRGTADDRRRIAEYCIQDCALCNHLIMKLEILANNMGMANVCVVPLSYIFMRGQGIKIFSLVLKACKAAGCLIPVVKPSTSFGAAVTEDDDVGYEGAIVLDPKEGMYLDDPVAVLDYASLYPSSMISENLSHDCYVEPGSEYDNLPGVEYLDISFDLYDDKKAKTGEKVCRFVQLPDGEKGIIPRILQKLLGARKSTRKKLEWKTLTTKHGQQYSGHVAISQESGDATIDGTTKVPKQDIESIQDTFNDFQKAVLDGLQNAYKVTANSLYGQLGARTSPLYLKEIAACTTAVGRKMIMKAKAFLEDNYCAHIVYGDSVAGYTPIVYRHGTHVKIDTVENIARVEGGTWMPCMERGKQSKEALELLNVQVWTDQGWTRACRLIRHRLAPHKRMVRVTTNTGLVDVTDDHSLLRPDGATIVKPCDLAVGESILHTDLPEFHNPRHGDNITEDEAHIMGLFINHGILVEDWAMSHQDSATLEHMRELCQRTYPRLDWKILTTPPILRPDAKVAEDIDAFIAHYQAHLFDDIGNLIVPRAILGASSAAVKMAFWQGLSDGHNRVSLPSQILAAGVFALVSSLGLPAHIKSSNGKSSHFTVILNSQDQVLNSRDQGQIQSITELSDWTQEYVYDFTTSNHKFAAGAGRIIAHNTDSLFVVFPKRQPLGTSGVIIHQHGHAAIMPSIQLAMQASAEFKKHLKPPHDLEFDKLFWPFILLSKKRYVGNMYEHDDQHYKTKSMGIVLKRRDNAPIVKKVYGGVVDILLKEQDIARSVDFLKVELDKLISGDTSLSELVVSKTLRSEYADPTRIAHKVLADRMGDRDPGNKPNINDRIPYVYVEQPLPDPTIPKCRQPKILQGERIEHPDYVVQHSLKPDYNFYITNQIMKPVVQLYSTVVVQLGIRPQEYYDSAYATFLTSHAPDKAKEKLLALKEKDVQGLLFDPFLQRIENQRYPDGKPPPARRKKVVAAAAATTSTNILVGEQKLITDMLQTSIGDPVTLDPSQVVEQVKSKSARTRAPRKQTKEDRQVADTEQPQTKVEAPKRAPRKAPAKKAVPTDPIDASQRLITDMLKTKDHGSQVERSEAVALVEQIVAAPKKKAVTRKAKTPNA